MWLLAIVAKDSRGCQNKWTRDSLTRDKVSHIISDSVTPRAWRHPRNFAIFRRRENRVNWTTRDKVFHVAQFQGRYLLCFQRNAGFAAAIEGPLSVLLPTAFTSIGEVQNAWHRHVADDPRNIGWKPMPR